MENSDIVGEQVMLLESVQKLLRNFKKESTAKKTVAYHKVRLDTLASYRAEFRANHSILARQSQKQNVKENYIDTGLCDTFEDAYSDAATIIHDSLATQMDANIKEKQSNTKVHPTSVQPTQCVPLPEIKLPTFTGKHIDWPAFKEIYVDRIHENESLSNLQRFHYLRSALSEDALPDIQHVGVVGENYKAAWEMLCSLYDNNRILFTHYMDVIDQHPDVVKDDPNSLKRFTQTCRACFSSLKGLGINMKDQNQLFVYYLIKKLPNTIRSEWDHSLRKQTEIPTFTQLLDLLDEQYLMMVTSSKTKQAVQRKSTSPRSTSFVKKELKVMHVQRKPITCPVCDKADHPVRECRQFLEMNVNERRNTVDKFKLCFNCLGYNHRSTNCSSRRTCGTCGGKHHTLIHLGREAINSALTTSVAHAATYAEQRESRPRNITPYDVLLPTAIVTIKTSEGYPRLFRALLDQGSQASFVNERVVQLLGLQRDKANISINGLSGTTITSSQYKVNLLIGSRLDPQIEYQVTAYVLPKVSGVLPTNKINVSKCNHLQGISLADPRYFEPQSVDVLLGSDVYDECIQNDTRKATQGLPIAQRTTFGYIVSGKRTVHSPTSALTTLYSSVEIDHLLRKFWESEEVLELNKQSDEDRWCEEFYKATTERLESGKYRVRLPIKTEISPTEFIGSSRAMALRRFELLYRRLSKDKHLKDAYTESIKEYLLLGQMKPVLTSEEQHCVGGKDQTSRYTCCYLPHHPVIRESSVSTKLRIVFDASMKTSNGKSLNDILATGPPQQRELSSILTNWRLFKYVFMADIEKMFRRIEMHDEDAQYQRVLWRDDPSQSMQEYYCSTVMFGTASAPYIAIRTMYQLAQDEREKFPLAAEIVSQQMYVDDILSGANTIEEAVAKQTQLINMLRSASFELRKWAGNHPLLLSEIPPEHRYVHSMLEFKPIEPIKALGLYWDHCADEFKFKIDFNITLETPTKRSILSNISRLFDPMGWLNPVVTSAKIILQRLWIEKIGWDAKLPEELEKIWRRFGKDLSAITQVRIPRWIGSIENLGTTEIHVFCDASQAAHSAVAYLRIWRKDGRGMANLLMAKSKVNPIKPRLTIPRAELCGAVLATKLLKVIKQNLSIGVPPSDVFMWTDSSIVLHWIRGDTSKWKPYVSNRIRKIMEETTPNQWRHVASADNPADISSRGISPSKLVDCDLWWHGANFLKLRFGEWPKQPKNMSFPDVEEEKRRVKTFSSIVNDSEPNMLREWSSLSKALRIVAYCMRFVNNCRPKLESRVTGRLTADDLNAALISVVRLVQREAFANEWNALSSNKAIPERSPLRPLNPYFDEEERTIRLGGRLKNALLPKDQKHPYILPAKHHFSNLVVKYSHLSTMHGGVTMTLNHTRRQFWIMNGRNVVRFAIHRCIVCYKNKPEACKQLMGDLPPERVRPAKVFSSTGVDYAGPFNVLPSRGRGRIASKGYIALFVCLATKAIHLELVGDLSSDAFIGALRRFMARRGFCKDIYSDCGTNFVGANRKLKEDRNCYQRFVDKIYPQLAQQQIRWHFIPPSSPHFGGLWEAGVKSTKFHLKRVIGEQKLTYEEFNTVLTQIESCLNSRPLCPLTSNPDDLMVLTPGHFLTGDSLLALPQAEINNTSIINRWLHCQKLVQHFWRQWTKEYLSRLQRRPKWLKRSTNVKLNDIVMVKDERFPCNQWPLGRVVELHPGADNLVRVVTLKTQNGLIKRPIVKLCPLPLEESWQDSSREQAL